MYEQDLRKFAEHALFFVGRGSELLVVFNFQKETGYLNIRSPCSMTKPIVYWLSVIHKVKGHLLQQPARLSVIWPCQTHLLPHILGSTRTEQLIYSTPKSSHIPLRTYVLGLLQASARNTLPAFFMSSAPTPGPYTLFKTQFRCPFLQEAS